MKVGDLVQIPECGGSYWWSGKVGIVDSIFRRHQGCNPEYRILVTPNRYVGFSDFEFVKIISKSR